MKKTTNQELGALLKPNQLQVQSDKVRVHNLLNRVHMAVGYPRNVQPGFLDAIVRAKGDFDLSLHIQPYSSDAMITNLNQLLRKLNADKYAAERKGMYTPSIDLLIRDTRKVLDQIQAGEEKLFQTSLYVNAKASDDKELNALSKKIESALNAVMIIPKRPYYKMREGLQSILPIGKDKLNATRTLTTSALSACFPFTSPFLSADKSGVMLGTIKQNGIPIIKDVFNFTNPNSLVLSTSGAGKSYLVKLFLVRQLMSGTRVFVIDPQGEYTALAHAVNGQIIELSKDSNSIINLFDPLGQPLDEKRLSLHAAFKLIFPKITEVQLALLDKAVTRAYESRGLYLDDKTTWIAQPPIFTDVHKALQEFDESKDQQLLFTLLEPYVSGVLSFLNKHTQLNLENDFICFNIQHLPRAVRPLLMYLVLEYVYVRMQCDKSRKILAIDEAWSLLSHVESSDYLFKIVKTSRKFNLAFTLITQEVNDLLAHPAGKAVLANTATKYLLKQDSSVIDSLIETMHLTKKERTALLTASLGEGILIADNERYNLKVIASAEEHRLITTKADELN